MVRKAGELRGAAASAPRRAPRSAWARRRASARKDRMTKWRSIRPSRRARSPRDSPRARPARSQGWFPRAPRARRPRQGLAVSTRRRARCRGSAPACARAARPEPGRPGRWRRSPRETAAADRIWCRTRIIVSSAGQPRPAARRSRGSALGVAIDHRAGAGDSGFSQATVFSGEMLRDVCGRAASIAPALPRAPQSWCRRARRDSSRMVGSAAS